jgi:hypothetical protein
MSFKQLKFLLPFVKQLLPIIVIELMPIIIKLFGIPRVCDGNGILR